MKFLKKNWLMLAVIGIFIFVFFGSKIKYYLYGES